MKTRSIERLTGNSLSRRALMRNSALMTGAAVLGGGILNPAAALDKHPKPLDMDVPHDLPILNFALGLEYLEQEFYGRAALADSRHPYLHDRLSLVVPSIRDDETAHVAALTEAIKKLGGTPVAMAEYSFPLDVFESPIAFARFAASLEEIGIGAYLGAISRIRHPRLRRAAASIYGVESRHAALLRMLGGEQFTPRYYEGALTMEQVSRLVAPYIVTPGSSAPAEQTAPPGQPVGQLAPATTGGGDANGGGTSQAPTAAPAS